MALKKFNEDNVDNSIPNLEAKVREHWKQGGHFRRSIEERTSDNAYAMLDGPPFATGSPHYGHLIAMTLKDVIPRYQTMQGHKVERRAGWDCHGLPVEAIVQEKLGLKGREEIIAYGIKNFSARCREVVLTHVDEWKKTQDLMGRWMDMEDPYMTMTDEYIESVWWVFKQLYDKGLIYEGKKVVPYSTGLSSPLSNFEVSDHYKDIEDVTVTVGFQIDGQPNTKLLAWTTTPWTLPANLGLAVAPKMEYVKVKKDGQTLILAESCRRSVLGHEDDGTYEIESRCMGSKLVGLTYTPLFPHFAHMKDEGSFKVIGYDRVKGDEGTGVIHIAPAYGEEDFFIGQEHNLGLVDPTNEDGIFTDEVPELEGLKFRESAKVVKSETEDPDTDEVEESNEEEPKKLDANQKALQMLRESGNLFAEGTIVHPYPHCWRTDKPLMYKAIPTWYVDVTKIKERLVAANQETNWMPSHLKDGRFGKWLEGARDWAISRNRFWGSPIPLWRCEETGEIIAIDSKQALAEASGKEIDDLHKDFVDGVTIEKDGKTFTRVTQILDCWFESGSVPYASIHHPFEEDGKLDETFPADFIAEGIDQTRGWFYTLIVLSTALFDKPAFKNVIVNGVLLAEDGKKMSKKDKNYTDPNVIMEERSADALRFYLMNSQAAKGESLRFNDEDMDKIIKKLLIPLQNIHKFFITYANADGWFPPAELVESIHTGKTEKPSGVLDKWILGKLDELQTEVTAAYEAYDMPRVTNALLKFIDDLSNWFIRLSRRRFWKNSSDQDKNEAYSTLFEVLTRYSQMLAPVSPFMSEIVYRDLTGEDSVHLSLWPKENESQRDPEIIEQMAQVRNLVTSALSMRNTAGIRVRQPLSELCIVGEQKLSDELRELVEGELNVKAVRVIESNDSAVFDKKVKLNFEKIGPKFKKDAPGIKKAVAEGNYTLADGRLIIGEHTLTEEEDYTLERVPNTGYAVSTQGGVTLALNTEITKELKLEGFARDLVRHIQEARKEAGLHVTDRIHLSITGADSVILEHGNMIVEEVLADQIDHNLDNPLIEKNVEIQGVEVKISLKKTSDE